MSVHRSKRGKERFEVNLLSRNEVNTNRINYLFIQREFNAL